MNIEHAAKIIRSQFGISIGESVVTAIPQLPGWTITLSSALDPVSFDYCHAEDATITDDLGKPIVYASLDLAYETYMLMCQLAYPEQHQYAVANTSFVTEARVY